MIAAAETIVHPDIRSSKNNILSALLATTNEDGMTPIQLAQFLGNQSIVGEIEKLLRENQHQYVYDMFCVEEVEAACDDGDACDRSLQGSDTNSLKADSGKEITQADGGNVNVIDEEDAVSVEIKGRLLGYWNEHGELILVHDDEYEKGEVIVEDDYDHDSNDELYEGNDYPEEEEEEESQSIPSSEVSSGNDSGINYHATTRQLQQRQRAYRPPYSLRDECLRNHDYLKATTSSNESSSFGEESSSSCEEEYEDRFSRRYFDTHLDRKKLQFVESSMLLKDKDTTYAYDSEYEDHE
jgi:hypothetical protein